MPFPGARAFLLTVLAVSASGQAVISTHSGVVHYFDGEVSLDNQPLEPHLGRFPSIQEGSELRTHRGRAEVLLTPGVILRMDENSAIRMVSNSLEDSRVELLSGSAMVDSEEPAPDTAVTLTYRDWQVRFPQKGQYRIDSAVTVGSSSAVTGRIWVRQGEADVTEEATGAVVAVNAGMDLPLAAALVAEESAGGSGPEPRDGLSNWARGRADSVSADNQIAANIQDPASFQDPALMDPALMASGAAFADPSLYGYTQFPMIGLAPLSTVGAGAYGAYGVSPYGSLYPYQLGFYSLYLPGYTYRPLFLGLPSSTRPPTSIYAPRTGIPIISTVPRSINGSTTLYAPLTPPRSAPIMRPMTPMVRPTPAPVPSGARRR